MTPHGLVQDALSPVPATSTTAWTYMKLALFAFALLGLELVLLFIEQLGSVFAPGLATAMVHWGLTIVVWASGSAALLQWARRHTDFFSDRNGPPRWIAARWSAIAVLVAITLLWQWALRGGIFPPVAEYAALSDRFGEWGTLAWLVQVAYYVAEVGVVAVIIGFGQRAGESWFHRQWMPWGGMTLAITWGLVHFLTQDAATGGYAIVLSLVMGTVYILAGRRLRVAGPILLVLFLL